MTPFDVIGKLTNQTSFRSATINEKIDLYFQDYSLIPLMVQENYIKVTPAMARESGLQGRNLNATHVKLLSEAAEAISMGDLLDTCQRK
jgi:replication factor C subunit 1